MPPRNDPRLLIGRETFDDAGIFQLSDDLALVQTVDFFAPIVDDPYTFGQIAAANALSDVYAMGGQPLTALNIVGFPADRLPMEVLSAILRGGQDVVHEAGAVVVGGHTILDDEVKYGLSVTGRVDPKRMLTNAAAQPGDRLVLTKPIGTGVLATSAKAGTLGAASERTLLDSMRRLNALASSVAVDIGARCATDVTGFGLLGHALHIARASTVTVVLTSASVPLLPGAREAVGAGIGTGGASRNATFVESHVRWGSVDETLRALLVDPQTSGGLLVAVPAARIGEYLARVPAAVEIGEIATAGDTDIVLV